MTHQSATRLSVINETLYIEYAQFVLIDHKTPLDAHPQIPEGGALVWAGDLGALFLTGASDQYVDIQLEIWTSEPAYVELAPCWDNVEDHRMSVDSGYVMLDSANFSETIQLPAPGTYRLRAYSSGRAAAAAAVNALVSPDEPVRGLERWLIQLWQFAD